MLHYHGTPITPNSQIEGMIGCAFCVSFAKPQNAKICLRIASSIMWDNGQFSGFTRGLAFDEPGYYAWLEDKLAHPHWAVVPDVIGGSVEEQRAMVKRWPFPRELGAPVWHLGLPIEYLLELTSEWPKVCLGSSAEYWQVGSERWAHRMNDAFEALARRHSRLPWVHGLRMLGQADGPWPLASADSTNVAQNFKRDTGCAACKARQIDAKQAPLRWTAKGQGRLIA